MYLARSSKLGESASPDGRHEPALDAVAGVEAPDVRAELPLSGRVEALSPDEQKATAQVVFLDQSRRSSTAGASWSFTSEEGTEAFTRVSDESGACTIPPGTWVLSATSGEWLVFGEPLVAEAGSRHIVWASPSADLEVVVLGVAAIPVADAIVRWIPRRFEEGDDPRAWGARPSREERTGPDGRARFDELAHSAGTLAVLADSYARTTRHLSGGTNRRLTVQLTGELNSKRTVRFVDALTGASLEDVSVACLYGPLPERSDVGGLVTIPGWISPQDFLYVESSTTCPTGLSLSSLAEQDTVRLTPATRLVLDIRDQTGARFRGSCRGLFRLLDPTLGSDGEVMLPELLDWDEGLDRILSVPQTGRVEVSILAGPAGAGRVEVEPQGRSAEVLIDLDATSPLQLVVRGQGLRDEKLSGEVRVRYRSRGTFRSLFTFGEPLPLPFHEEIVGFSLEAPGFIPARVRRARNNDPRGTLEIELAKSHVLRIRFVDEIGDPVAGVAFQLSEGRIPRPRPPGEAPGTYVTNLPGWLEIDHHDLQGTSDYNGCAEVHGVRTTEYLIQARLHPATIGLTETIDLSSIDSRFVQVEANGEVTLTMSRRVRRTLEVFDALTHAPLPTLLVSSGSSTSNAIANVSGNFWEGWIPADWPSLWVSSPGYERLEILKGSFDASGSMQAFLWAKEPLVIEFGGDINLLRGEQVLVKTLQLAESGNYYRPLWTCQVPAEDGFLRYHDPFVGELFLQLDPIEKEDYRLLFEPSLFERSRADGLRVFVRREDADRSSR